MASRKAQVHLSLRGLEEVATSMAMHAAIDRAAEKVGSLVEAQGIRVQGVPGDIALPVKVHTGDTTSGMKVNRAQARVVLAHASGLAVQGKHGALSRAASEAGLTLKGEGPDDLIEYTTKRGVTRMATRAQVANWTRGSA